MSYRPITDMWLLARPKVRYYGAYPSGFLSRARALLGVAAGDCVLHVCSGKVKDYPFAGFGSSDYTLDLDPALQPDFVQDCREPLPRRSVHDLPWDAILADPPYTPQDAQHYLAAADSFPNPRSLLLNCLRAVNVGSRVGMLHVMVPRPPKTAKLVALVSVVIGFNNVGRLYSVYERTA